MLDGHMYFHTGKNGYKLTVLASIACVLLDSEAATAFHCTHNFRSV